MTDHQGNLVTCPEDEGQTPQSEGRRGFLKLAALTGAAASLSTRRALANGDIGYHAMDLPDDKLVDMYRTILRIRWHERTQADQMLANPDYRGYNHFYAGQEAVATGVCAALRNDGPFEQIDLVYSSHRPSGHAIAKGVDIPTMVAEMDFRATGMNGGYAAEMHISDPSVGFIGADGMIGPAPVIASGSAFAFRARGSDQVAVVFAGDGNYAAPHFHSTLNNAKLLDLPLIYVCENNLYHQYAHYSYSCPHKDIADAAAAYGIPSRTVDGQDVTQVYNVAKEAVDRARAGGGPSFIEAKTYRYYNHWGAPGAKEGELGAFGYDPLAITSFRPEREVRAWMQRDPVDIARNILVGWGILEEQKALDIEAEVKAEIAAAFEWALSQPLCTPEDGLKHVFAEGTVPARQFG
ncbi:thiamine pyrophosphate-dependent dehydrogenase E1 component subunit alpha [Defluviimonas sp. WL0024]|uniref:Thiamine pyrophosphate-dependent dehydrogenase E1 component subunit alpha n=1 Tax=Albidovulum salinarum TaxID=2984153 RepID=A0ABT2X7R5_9RHOB|nr:thiamine pyrophosphate-dependent dehydrogenase E1 component subunit alpha [Defluviimonas sp. WL0024]MCU9849993.1 thiamine pyrophosphate-dependent dehydrogenase E1 component subunit alpha [Defluviimonas sp. WL0024]